jgi:uncharacterized protein (UPF0276 family)
MPSTPNTMPARAGLGFKPEHFAAIASTWPALGFLEVHAENYFGEGGPPQAMLAALSERYPLSLHGIGLSIGGSGRLDPDHLARLKRLHDRIRPALFSEHLAWSSHGEVFWDDLLPLPYTEATLATVVEHVDEVQAALGRQMLLENPSTYVSFAESTLPETAFLAEVAQRTGCGLLLDVNNVFVSAINHMTSPEAYLKAFPVEAVGEIHLGGHAPAEDETGAALLIDAHDRPVADPVWALYEQVVAAAGPRPTLIEWDNDVPALPVLLGEAARAEAILGRRRPRQAA